MPNHPEIYRSQADQYDALVTCEDYQHHLLPALQQVLPLEGITVAEFGAGTGRLTCLLAPLVRQIHAFDLSPAMLELAVRKLTQSGAHNWQVMVADHRQVNLPDGAADLAISGWSVCYVAVDNPQTWSQEISRTLREMERVVHAGGKLVLIETLGTGSTTPNPPQHLVAYYTWLEEHGFQRSWIRTDYRFKSLAEAQALSAFFFGEAMLEKIESSQQGILLPECTGIWQRDR